MSAKITFKLVRSFSIGFTISSPKLNGLHVVLLLGCFHVQIWSRGKTLFSARSYWA